MKVTIENKKGLSKDLKVFIDKKTMASHFDEKYNEISINPLYTMGKNIIEINNFESINISKSMLKNYNNIVALKISGDSMKGDLIMDGDIIILDCNNISTNDIKSGDIVVARVDEDYATLKRMFINKNKIELRPSNKLYSSIYTDKKNVKIDGKVVGLVRNY